MGIITRGFSKVGLLFGRRMRNCFLVGNTSHGLISLVGHRIHISLSVSLFVGGVRPDSLVASFGRITEHFVGSRLRSIGGLLVDVLVCILRPVLPRLLRPRGRTLRGRPGLGLGRFRGLIGIGDRLVGGGVRPRQGVHPGLLGVDIHVPLLLLCFTLELLNGLLARGVLPDFALVRGLGGCLGDFTADIAPRLRSNCLQLVAPHLRGVLLDLLRAGLPGLARLDFHIGLLEICCLASRSFGGSHCCGRAILRIHLRAGRSLRGCRCFTCGGGCLLRVRCGNGLGLRSLVCLLLCFFRGLDGHGLNRLLGRLLAHCCGLLGRVVHGLVER
mmetsp:Transcript_22758/g.49875  ORF Transcript_22758/g.49875 Transcript_22758/m.49875 type:complete len:329 (+) Transcript_22758:858-1844(+)